MSSKIPSGNLTMTDRYAEVHLNPDGPGDARPTALQIIHDEGLTGKLKGKVIVITGCSSGIGVETARALSSTGATLFLGVRNVEKGEYALADILEPGRVELFKLDLGSFQSVRDAAKNILARGKGSVNILICNAGVMALPEGRTVDGFEVQLATNHLSHFLLFNLLKPALLASSSDENHSRVVLVSSIGHRFSPVHFDNLNLDGTYDPWIAYGQSKTANIYMANEIERRYGATGRKLHGLSLHPGGIATGLQQHVADQMKEIVAKDPSVLKTMKSPEQGAATTVLAAIGQAWEGKGGLYLEECQVAEPAAENAKVADLGYAPWAYSPPEEERLWQESLKMVGLADGA